MSEILQIELTHSIAWMLCKKQWPQHNKWANGEDISIDMDVHKDQELVKWLTHDNDDNSFHALEKNSLIQIDESKCSYDYEVWKFSIDTSTLREHLTNAVSPDRKLTENLIGIFLQNSSQFGDEFKNYGSGEIYVLNLPIEREQFDVPDHFMSVMNALVTAGYAAKRKGSYQWSENIALFMEEAGLWSGNKTKYELREAEFLQIWNTMPSRLKSPFIDQGQKVKALDVVSFSFVMGHFWYDGKWHNEPESSQSLKRGDLVGGHVGTARELGNLFKAGKLKF